MTLLKAVKEKIKTCKLNSWRGRIVVIRKVIICKVIITKVIISKVIISKVIISKVIISIKCFE
jgi:hypothetical protein